jgi:hypothetical protein
MNTTLWIGVVATLSGSSLHAQDIAGDWQGTFKMGAEELRIVAKIAKGNNGNWKATSIDQTPDRGTGMPVDPVTLKDSILKF